MHCIIIRSDWHLQSVHAITILDVLEKLQWIMSQEKRLLIC